MRNTEQDYFNISKAIFKKYKIDCELNIKHAEPGIMYTLEGKGNRFKAVLKNNAEWSIIKQ